MIFNEYFSYLCLKSNDFIFLHFFNNFIFVLNSKRTSAKYSQL
jgi:hypothetical protein